LAIHPSQDPDKKERIDEAEGRKINKLHIVVEALLCGLDARIEKIFSDGEI
jgi:hypothetical protein